MDLLAIIFSQLIMTVNSDLRRSGVADATRFAEELRRIYFSYRTRTGRVDVRVTSSGTIEIERGGVVRALEVAADGFSWELAGGVGDRTSDEIGAILASP